ncbi:hypothetical protein [Burkholderia aenigmatica]|uniref:Uncharacterized protein n=1 Tax=Burkholderia aenigmatica TaxID=2015348 RepID=A0A228II87_9BURK|nr:hypothetical protein [Burkholderia aenigmatica]OXI42140.1 hypothetical protein CFB84_23145 [Burkholderia aenigmatica]
MSNLLYQVQIDQLRVRVTELHARAAERTQEEVRERIVTEILRQGYAPSHAVTDAAKVYKFITDGK